MNGPETAPPRPGIPDQASREGVASVPSPEEPFPCPNCGQMLGAGVRVCAACHQPVDISKLGAAQHPAVEPEQVELKPAIQPSKVERARFSWGIFAYVLVAWLAAALLGQRFLNPLHEQFFLAGIVCVTSIWVFYDARLRNIPHPFRWSIASILFWIIFFPWYLSRRRTPKASCPLMEESAGQMARWIIPIFLVFLLFVLIVALWNGAKK